MGWFFKRHERRIEALEEELRELRGELVYLRDACTMRVGERNSYLSQYIDSRPVLTAMDAVRKLMADAGIEPSPVRASRAYVEFVQQHKGSK